MAAGSFEFSSFSKRKRIYDEDDLICGSSKRQHTYLPIRSPPRLTALAPSIVAYTIPPGTLTPDSIPEVDEYQQNINHDVEMDAAPTRSVLMTPIRMGRARSNDLISPLRPSTGLLPPSPRGFAQDRMPTPVASSFPARSPFEASFAAASKHMRTQLTSLSPMVDAESWTPRVQRPPSPDDEDEDMMGVEDSSAMSSSFSSLSVHNSPFQTSPTRASRSIHRGLGLDSYGGVARPDDLRMSTINDQRPASYHGRQQSSGRTGRLHMGYKADCEKCVARVPGHYSHVIWS